MKQIILLIILISFFNVHSQSKETFEGRKKPYTCQDIIKTKNELRGKSESNLPDEFILSPISFGRVKIDTSEAKLLRFYIQNYPYKSTISGVYFKLANGELITMPEVKVSSKYSSGSYSLFGGIRLDEELIRKLKDNFVVQFSMGDKVIDIEERHRINLQTLFNCMFEN
ncbi:MAG TPA: hypothetical protein VFR70_06390 [Flavobacterium sp.]|nr:hypothetical protein [Flavobacterium sp.]